MCWNFLSNRQSTGTQSPSQTATYLVQRDAVNMAACTASIHDRNEHTCIYGWVNSLVFLIAFLHCKVWYNLRNCGVGCFWDSVFAGAMGYADDVVLLSPSPAALRIMLHCCEDFAFERGLQFNPSN